MKRFWQRWAARFLLAEGIAACACAQTEDPDSNLGSETHWLTLCETNAECGKSGLSCECGVCSLPCAEDAQCAGYDATCRAALETATSALCGDSTRAVGICLPQCDQSCAEGQSCLGGACVPTAAVTRVPGVNDMDAGQVSSPVLGGGDAGPGVTPVPLAPNMGEPDSGQSSAVAMPDASVPDASVPAPPDGAPASATPSDAGTVLDAALAFPDASEPVVDSGTVVDASYLDAGTSGVALRAIVVEVTPGNPGVAAEWVNGTLEPIYLKGCGTASGWSFDGTEWQEYGGFIVCATEGPMVVVAPGEIFRDAAGIPPDRELDIWRLVGTYGVGCVPAEGAFSEVNCASLSELTSNQVTLTR